MMIKPLTHLSQYLTTFLFPLSFSHFSPGHRALKMKKLSSPPTHKINCTKVTKIRSQPATIMATIILPLLTFEIPIGHLYVWSMVCYPLKVDFKLTLTILGILFVQIQTIGLKLTLKSFVTKWVTKKATFTSGLLASMTHVNLCSSNLRVSVRQNVSMAALDGRPGK